MDLANSELCKRRERGGDDDNSLTVDDKMT